MSDKIKVLIVDDSAYSRQTIKGMLETDSEIEVVGIASNGIEAMSRMIKLKPDVITLDFEMPEMDGFSFLRWLMKNRPTPVVMVTSFSDSSTVFRALELGAVDFIAKPSRRASVELRGIQDDLLEKVKGIRELKMEKLDISRNLVQQTPSPVALPLENEEKQERGGDLMDEAASPQRIRVVAIGASTGGPAALQVILTRLPANLPAAILISQHMPKGFTKSFTERLARLSQISIKEAADGDVVEEGRVLVCPGGHHMAVKSRQQIIRVALKDSTIRDKYTPSVDMMMTSAAEHLGPDAMGVILTGMGNDGKMGMVEINRKGGYTIAEAESTAVIFGMPSEAIRTGAVDRVLPLHKIPSEITMAVTRKRDKKWKKS